MPTTYEAIATVTVGSGGASNIEFTSIPGTYTDLAIFVSGRYTGGGNQATLWISAINGSTSNLTNRWLRGSGSGTFSSTDASGGIYVGQANGSSSTSNTFTNVFIYIPNYTASANKSISIDAVQENNQTEAYMSITAGLWSNTAAITSITIDPDGTNTFAQYSTATLYGIKNS
jgi:hypothetical protein